MNLSEIKAMARRREYDAALHECDELVEAGTVKLIEVMRVRASIHAAMRDFSSAVETYQKIVEEEGAHHGDYFLGANYAIAQGEMRLALYWLAEVIQMGRHRGNTALEPPSLFYSSYACMELGRFEEARDHLAKAKSAEPKISLPIPGDSVFVDAAEMSSRIDRREMRW